jgi:hypothetical protein
MKNKRPLFLTIMSILFVALAISNATKVLQIAQGNPISGFVFFGNRFHDSATNLMLGLPFAALLLTYAFGLWKMKKWVAWIAVPYAFYVPTNLTLFWFFQPADNLPSVAFIVGYLILALGGSVGTGLYVMRYFDRLED